MMHLMVMVVKHTVKPPCKTTHLDGQPWAPPASRSVNSVLGQRHRELDRRGRFVEECGVHGISVGIQRLRRPLGNPRGTMGMVGFEKLLV
jgi:hypothetical protein